MKHHRHRSRRRNPSGRETPGEPITFSQAMRLAARFVRLGKRQGTRTAVAGGLAMALYGHTRMTADVDLIAAKPLLKAARYWCKNIWFGGNSYKVPIDRKRVSVDVIVRDDASRVLYESSLDMTRTLRGLPVISPEHLVLMKLEAGRHKDLSDVQFLLKEGITTPEKVTAVAQAIGGIMFANDKLRQATSLRAEALAERSKYGKPPRKKNQ